MPGSIINWLKANRLKAASACAITGDVLMGAAGGVGILNRGSLPDSSYALLLTASCLGLTGHITLMLWGKGARAASVKAVSGVEPPVWRKPFYPWRYPLDFAFSLWIVASLLYMASGFHQGAQAMIFMGLCSGMGSSIGWLYPQEKLLFGRHVIQVTALCFFLCNIFAFAAAYMMQDMIVLLAACSFTMCSLILYTVRKENQSAYTQAHS